MIKPEDIEKLLKELGSGDGHLPLFRDDGAETGLRPWTADDSVALCRLLLALSEERNDIRHDLTCFNQREVAELLGVSVHKIQALYRRVDQPIPHIQDGRRMISPAFLLKEWMRSQPGPNCPMEGM